MREIGKELAETTRLRFRNQAGPDGKPWAALKPGTLARRRKGKGTGGAKALLDTGRLRGSITYRAGEGWVEVGTNTIYASTHQFGAKRGAYGSFSIVKTRRVIQIPWGDVPARPFLGLSQADRQAVLDIVRESLERATTRA